MNAATALSCLIKSKVTLNKLEHTQHLLLTAKTFFCMELKSLLCLRATGDFIKCGIY